MVLWGKGGGGGEKGEDEKEEEEEEKNSKHPFLLNSSSRGKNATTSKSRENLKNLYAEQFRVPAISNIEKDLLLMFWNKIKQNFGFKTEYHHHDYFSLQPTHIDPASPHLLHKACRVHYTLGSLDPSGPLNTE